MDQLKKYLNKNAAVQYILENLNFPDNLEWLLVGGCIYQPIWNELTGRNVDYGIKDFDISYWDDDLSSEKEEKIANDVENRLFKLHGKLDVVNQARVHLWFKKHFGVEGRPFINLQQAMTTHPFRLMSVGINQKEICAPYGTKDIFEMKLIFNSITHIPREHVFKKMNKWLLKWPELKVVKQSFPRDYLPS